MLLFEQLQLIFERSPVPTVASARQIRRANASSTKADPALEALARRILCSFGAPVLAEKISVEWNPRLRSCAGRADSNRCLITLNPRLLEHGPREIDRTFRHELAHLLAQFRAGRRRVAAHGEEWRRACRDLGIGDETRCHTLPFPVRRREPRYHYICPNCQMKFPRARRIRRAIACLACCRKFNRGKFEARFRLRLVSGKDSGEPATSIASRSPSA